ncbi:MAG: hypothetical protein BWY83_03141 [bacterium ADurb.Bin478]|nr:MAG: hypothetical protein BWY83_03141 [bacterium ADurb.Bin478]
MDDRAVHGRHAGEQRHPVFFNVAHHPLQIKARLQNQRGLRLHRQMMTGGHAVAVAQGQHAQHGLVAVLHIADPCARLQSVGHCITMADHGRLGDAGDPTGEQQQGRQRSSNGRQHRGRPAGQQLAKEKRIRCAVDFIQSLSHLLLHLHGPVQQGRHIGLQTSDHHMSQLGLLADFAHSAVDAIQHDQHSGAA